jgi:hypothetical protein
MADMKPRHVAALALVGCYRGHVMMGIAAGLRNNPSPTFTPEQRQSAITYFETFGGRLIDIPTKCDQANNAMAAANAQEQQAEAQHQVNVNRSLAAAALIFTGAVVFTSAVGAAAATRPPFVENNFYNNQFNGY